MSLDLVRARLAAGEDGRILRLHGNHLHVRQARLDHLGDAGDRPAGADTRHEGIELAVGVVPDFLRRGLAVDLRIGRVLELLRDDRVRDIPEQLLCARDGALHALGTRGELKLRAEIGQHLAAFKRHGLGHDQDQTIAARRRHEGERDAGIAGGRLDQGRIGIDLAGGLHGLDHADADAVLDARNRVEELELDQDLGINSALLRQPVQAHERGVADGFRNRAVDAAAAGLGIGARQIGSVSHQFPPSGRRKLNLSRRRCRYLPQFTHQIVKSMVDIVSTAASACAF